MTAFGLGGSQHRGAGSGHRTTAIVVVLLLVATLTSCGGSEAEDVTTEAPDGTTAATQARTTVADVPEPEPPTTTEATEAEPEPSADVSSATVSIAGETYTFGETGFVVETCDPDFFGGAQVILQMVDENGEGMVIGDQIRPVGIALIPSDPGSTAVNVPTTDPDREWIADASSLVVEGSQVDDWSIEGNRIQGTATFVSTAGEGPEQGTFEAVCSED